jgi:Pectate lyase superfamily protein
MFHLFNNLLARRKRLSMRKMRSKFLLKTGLAILALCSLGLCSLGALCPVLLAQTPSPQCPTPTIPYRTVRDSSGNLHDVACINPQTGQINWTVNDWGGQVYNVKAFGAKGNGIADDTQAFKSVVASLPLDAWGQPYGIIYIPDGVYKITSTIAIHSQSVILQGQNQYHSILDDHISSGFTVEFTPLHPIYSDTSGGLRDLTIQLNGSSGNSGVRTLDFAGGFTMEHVNINQVNSATTGDGSVGWRAENSAAQTERSILDHVWFGWCDVGIQLTDDGSGNNSVEHSLWQDVRWNLNNNQHAIQINNDIDISDSLITGTINPNGTTGMIIFETSGSTNTYNLYTNIYVDGTGTGFSAGYFNSGAIFKAHGGIFISNATALTFTCAGTAVCSLPVAGMNGGKTWSSSNIVPSGTCVNGSLYTNTAGGAGTTFYVCVAGAWTDIK